MERLEDESYSVDGRIPMGTVNEAVGSNFEIKDFDTIGRLVIGQLERAPEIGDEVRLGSCVLRVEGRWTDPA